MSENWELVFKIAGGGMALSAIVTAICMTIRQVWIAKIQQNKDSMVEVRQNADGTSDFSIKGYSQYEAVKLSQQLTHNPVIKSPEFQDSKALHGRSAR